MTRHETPAPPVRLRAATEAAHKHDHAARVTSAPALKSCLVDLQQLAVNKIPSPTPLPPRRHHPTP